MGGWRQAALLPAVDALAMLDQHFRHSRRLAFEKALDRYVAMMPLFPYLDAGDRPSPPEPRDF